MICVTPASDRSGYWLLPGTFPAQPPPPQLATITTYLPFFLFFPLELCCIAFKSILFIQLYPSLGSI